MPEGWVRTTIGDMAETALGKMLDAPRPRGTTRVPYLRNLNVQWGHIDLDDVQQVPLSDDERERFALEPGDLLVCEGGEIGRAALWRGGSGCMAYQKALHRIRSRGDLDLTFLRCLLEHYLYTGELHKRAAGSTILHLPQRQLRELPIPLPPRAEQRRIVEILEDHLSRLDAASSNAQSAEARPATLRDAWIARHPSLSPARRMRLNTVLAAPLANGGSVPDGDGFPVLRLTSLRGGRVDLAEFKSGRWSAKDAAPFLVARGDGKIVNELRDADPASLAAAGPIRTSRPPPSDPARISEDEVKQAVKSHLESQGFSVTVAWGREGGIDTDARGGDDRSIVEAKGGAPRGPQQVSYFRGALGELRQLMDDDTARYALAVPDDPQYRGLVTRLPLAARRRLDLTVFFVRREVSALVVDVDAWR
jgi:hypothetical protein